MVTKDTKNDDMFGRELPRYSNAISGVSTISASVSNTVDAIVVTKKIFKTWNMK